MLKKVIEFKDFDGNEQKMEAYFNLTQPELVRLETEYPGGLEKHIEEFDPENKPGEILDMFEKIIRQSYGRKSDDGVYFLKDSGEANRFLQSAAYEALFMDLISDTQKATDFINAVLGQGVKLSVNNN